MRGKDRDVIGERKDPLAQRFVSGSREPALQPGAEEIHARHVPDEQRATREQVVRVVRSPQIGHQVGDVLRCVPRGRETADVQLADADLGLVGMRFVRVLHVRVLTRMDGDGPNLGERARAGYVVVVDVGLERIGDQHAEPRRGAKIRVDLPIGVDEEGDAGIGVGDKIARVSETGVEELLDQHGRTIPAGSIKDRGASMAETLFTRRRTPRPGGRFPTARGPSVRLARLFTAFAYSTLLCVCASSGRNGVV